MKRLTVTLLVSEVMLWVPPCAHAGDEFHGLIESRPAAKAGTWVIGGRQVLVTEQTKLEEEDGPLAVGACAEVEYEGNVVEEIESEEKSKCGR